MKLLRLDSTGTLREYNVATGGESPQPEIVFFEEYRPLTGAEAAQKIVSLIGFPDHGSIYIQVGSTTQLVGIDFTIETTVCGLTEIHFIGGLGVGGVSEVEKDDLFFIRYAIQPPNPAFEFQTITFTLSLSDISNQYLDVPCAPILANTEQLLTAGLTFARGRDYTLEERSGATRFHFSGEIVSSGVAALAVGDTIQIRFAKAI